MDISVSKIGKGITVVYALKNSQSLRIAEVPARYCVEMVRSWLISFGAQESPTDLELTRYMINITAPWDLTTKTCRKPWHDYLSGQLWRAGEQGEIVVQAVEELPADKSLNEQNPQIPWNAARPRTFIEATRPKEIKGLLKSGRDSNWPLKITVASTLEVKNSVSVTYGVDWEHCRSEKEWFLRRFYQAAQDDGLAEPSRYFLDRIADSWR
jgi:hypothetical protein